MTSKLKTSFSLSNLTTLDKTTIEPESKWLSGMIKESHFVVPPSADRIKLSTLHNHDQKPFAISFSAIDGLKSTAENKVFAAGKTQIHLNLSLYDSACRQFLGRTWTGPEVTYKGGGKLPYNQTVYLHSSLNDTGIFLVVELVAVTQTDHGEAQTFGCGWGVYRLFKPDVKLVDMSDNTPASAKRIEIYQGSPRTLLYIDGEIEGNSNLIKSGSQILCAILVHKLLMKVIHLIPENVIVGQKDLVPGLLEGQKDPKTGATDNFKKPRIAKPTQCSLEKMTVRLSPSLEKFEEDVCKKVLEEYLLRAKSAMPGKRIQITKRFLKVGVHNGWTFVSHPEEIRLIPNSESSGGLNKSASFKRGHQRAASAAGINVSGATELVHKSRVEIDGLLEDPLFHVIFTLVYEVTVPSQGPDETTTQKTALAQPMLDIVVGWGAVSPASVTDSKQMTVQLYGGTLANPDSTFVYRSGQNLTEPGKSGDMSGGPTGSVTFTVNINNKGKENVDYDEPSSQSFQLQQKQPQAIASQSLVSVTSEDSDLLRSAKRGRDGRPPMSARSAFKRDVQSSSSTAGGFYDPYGYPQQLNGYLHYQQSMMMPGPMSARDMMNASTDLHELPYGPTHIPILATIPGMHSGQGLSRAAYAKLHSVGFPPILDRHGKAAEAVDPSDCINFVLAKEDADRLKVNEIALQFMAFSRLASFESKQPSTIFFTFQFYRFQQVTSERLLLGKLENDLSADKNSLPFILQKFDKDGTILKGPPGYQVKYVVDPAYMKNGESQLFVKYLAEQTLHIDVWDGDSLLLIGSCIVELQHLCRQGREAVQVSYELDVMTTEFVEREMVSSGDQTKDGSLQPTEVSTLLKGRLHLRMGNVGHPLDAKLSKTKTTTLAAKTSRQIIRMDDLPTSLEELYKSRVCKAQHMADISQELAQLIRSRRMKATGNTEDDANQRLPVEKTKKLARMEAVRQTEKIQDTAPIMTIRKDKDERNRDLKTIELFRTHNKRDSIINMLNLAITTDHTIHASLGTTEFFEFVLKNPYNTEITISIEWKDMDLEVITNPVEWRHFKMLNEIYTSLEEGMFNTESKSGGRPEIFLRAKETVHVPFKFLSFKADHSVNPQVPTDPFKPTGNQYDENRTIKRNDQKSRVIKVYFRNPELKPIAILSVKVESQPHIIDQTFRLNHPEQTFLKKSFRLPPLHSIADLPVGGPPLNQIFVRCSDCNVICESRKVQPGEPHDIFIKVACGASPQVKKFFVAVYIDPYLSSPILVWQLYIQTMQRIDVAALQGQTSRFALVLRGTQASRLVQCFTSHPHEMEVQPKDAFVLPANALQEIHVGVRPIHLGNKSTFINVVDVEFHQLVRSWLVSVISRQPIINKSFELSLPVGGGKGSNKKISFTNPYATRKLFHVRTNRDDLLQLKDNRLELGPAESVPIGLRFAPAMAPGYVEILVFINDEDDKNEETFCVKATYQN